MLCQDKGEARKEAQPLARGPWPGSFDVAEGLSSGGTRELAGGRGGRRDTQGDRHLVLVQLLLKPRSGVCLGSEGPRGSVGKAR